MVTVSSFYRFVELPDQLELRESLRDLAMLSSLLGTILIATEGINGTLAGTAEAMDDWFEKVGIDPRFKNLERRTSLCSRPPFRKLKVRLKKEIVRMNKRDANPNEGVGRYVEPKDWNSVISDPSVKVIDVRNTYETQIGTFERAIDPVTGQFGQFPNYVETELPDKNQPIAMFCTGGIRCERATAWLVQNGYKNVMHLKGGILNYLETIPVKESLWKGSCFVFDYRRAVDHQLNPVETPEVVDAWERSLRKVSRHNLPG